MKVTCREYRDHLRNAARRCEHCKRKLPAGSAEIAHIYAKGMGAGGQLDIPCNLVPLGGPGQCQCHLRQHNENENPSAEDLKAVVAKRYRTAVDVVQAELDRALNQLRKGDVYQCPFTDFWWQRTVNGYEWGM